jgi:hypothetical protein
MAVIDNKIFSGVWFQLTWFSCVFGRDDWMLLTAVMIAFHYAAVTNLNAEFNRVWPCALIGIVTDLTLSLIGVFDFGDALLPMWMVCLWWVFPAALPRAFGFLSASWWRPIVLGATVPTNYLVGARVGAVDLPYGELTTFLILAPIWMVLLYIMVRLSDARLVPAQ